MLFGHVKLFTARHCNVLHLSLVKLDKDNILETKSISHQMRLTLTGLDYVEWCCTLTFLGCDAKRIHCGTTLSNSKIERGMCRSGEPQVKTRFPSTRMFPSNGRSFGRTHSHSTRHAQQQCDDVAPLPCTSRTKKLKGE